MSEPWVTIAPVTPHWEPPRDLPLPFAFAPAVTFALLPEWLRSIDSVDVLRPKLLDRIDDGARYCIRVEYLADALGSPDPAWTGEDPRGIQETAAELVRYVGLALWLARPSGFSFALVAHIADHGSEKVIRRIEDYDPFCPLPEYATARQTAQDFVVAHDLFKTLREVSLTGPLRISAQLLFRALTENGWTLRFLLFWLTVESMFGPEDARETTYRISQRLALFLEQDRTAARGLFRRIRESYSWRSKVVHGLRLAKLTPEKSQELLTELENLVRRALLAILAQPTLVTTFDGKNREDYLDELAFQ